MLISSYEIALQSFAAIFGDITGLTIDPGVVNVAGLPVNRTGGGLHAQPLAAYNAMGFSRRLILLNIATFHCSPQLVGRVTGRNPTLLIKL